MQSASQKAWSSFTSVSLTVLPLVPDSAAQTFESAPHKAWVIFYFSLITVLPLVPDSAAQTFESAPQKAWVIFYCTFIDGAATSTRFRCSKLCSQLYRRLGSSFTALSLTVLPLVPDSAAQNCAVSFTESLDHFSLLHF